MLAELKPYPKYIVSGLQWLGDVPAHWQLLRLGAVLQERKEMNEYGEITYVLSVVKTRGVIPYEEKGNIGNKKSEDITRYKIVRPGDIVINCMNVIIGSSGLSKYTGCLSPIYYVLRQRMESANVHYLAAIFHTSPFYRRLIRLGSGILPFRMRIPMELLKCEIIPFPPASEQAAIICFLDKAITKIESVIAAKEKIITLLEEQKRALIHRTITRGLDSSVALRPSGIAFIGDIPTHWKIAPLKYCMTKFYSGGTPDSANADYYCAFDEGVPWLMISDMTGQRYVDRTQTAITSKGIMSKNLDLLPAGTILISMYASIGTVAVLKINATINQAIIGMCPDSKILNAEYCLYCMESMQPYIARFTDSSTQENLNAQKVRNLPIIIPPLSEQTAIIKYLNDATATINASAKCARREIALLYEYRDSLIANAVTGKIDVRNFAPSSPKGKKRI